MAKPRFRGIFMVLCGFQIVRTTVVIWSNSLAKRLAMIFFENVYPLFRVPFL